MVNAKVNAQTAEEVKYANIVGSKVNANYVKLAFISIKLSTVQSVPLELRIQKLMKVTKVMLMDQAKVRSQ